MPRESNDAGAKSSLASSEDQRLVRARIALAISVVVYLSLAGLSAAWFPSYPFIPVALVAFGAHSAVYLCKPDLLWVFFESSLRGLWGGVARHRQVRTSAFAYPTHVYDLSS